MRRKASRCIKYRLDPNEKQIGQIRQTFGCDRYVWNQLLEERIEYAKENDGKLLNSTPAHLKEKAPWLKDVDSLALANTQLHLNQAWKAKEKEGRKREKRQTARDKKRTPFSKKDYDLSYTPEYERPEKEWNPYPSFMAKYHDKRSYTTNCINGNIYIIQRAKRNSVIRLPKLGEVRIILHRSIPDGWVLKSCTISETGSGRFYISLTFDVMIKEELVSPKGQEALGLDMSVSNGFVPSDPRFDIPDEECHWYRRMEERLAYEQQKLSRMEVGSNHWIKQKHKIAKIHEKAAARRLDYYHKKAKAIADAYAIVGIEDIDLTVQAQIWNHGKSVNDAAFGLFKRILSYKMEWRGGYLIKVSRAYPSSQRCSVCGELNPDVRDWRNVRKWECPHCHAKHERDRNASENLAQEATEILRRWTSGKSSLLRGTDGILKEVPRKSNLPVFFEKEKPLPL